MLHIYKRMQAEKLESKMLLQVHDELVFECPKAELDTLRQLVQTEMENAYTLQVPLTVDIGVGQNWLEAH
ncbi:MAG: DNA polymerase, partial [Flavobacteriaceae bacterium]